MSKPRPDPPGVKSAASSISPSLSPASSSARSRLAPSPSPGSSSDLVSSFLANGGVSMEGFDDDSDGDYHDLVVADPENQRQNQSSPSRNRNRNRNRNQGEHDQDQNSRQSSFQFQNIQNRIPRVLSSIIVGSAQESTGTGTGTGTGTPNATTGNNNRVGTADTNTTNTTNTTVRRRQEMETALTVEIGDESSGDDLGFGISYSASNTSKSYSIDDDGKANNNQSMNMNMNMNMHSKTYTNTSTDTEGADSNYNSHHNHHLASSSPVSLSPTPSAPPPIYDLNHGLPVSVYSSANGSFSQSPENRNNNTIMNNSSSYNTPKVFLREILNGDQNNDHPEMSPALKRRLRDFTFAQRKRREKYGKQSPWGIIGLYDHLTGIRTDIEWAEDAAWRRENDQPYLSWTDFEDAKDTGFNQPFFTYIVMFVCTVCLVVSIGINGWSVEPLKTNPMIGPSEQTLIDMGAKKTSLIIEQREWYRLITPMVLHAGVIHYVLNMLALWFIGGAIEQSHGFFAAALLFILPAIGGTIFSALFLPEYTTVGASGGIFGLIGACLADIVSNWSLLFSKVVNNNDEGTRFRHVKILLWLILDIILNVVIGLTPFVDNFVHMGGMIYGFLCGLSTMERLSKAFFGIQRSCTSNLQTFLIRFLGIIISLICILVSGIILGTLGEADQIQCTGCRYVSCVPFPFWADKDNKWWYCDDCHKIQDVSVTSESGYYVSMNLTCPNGASEFIELVPTLEKTSENKEELAKQLPAFCRNFCDEVFTM